MDADKKTSDWYLMLTVYPPVTGGQDTHTHTTYNPTTCVDDRRSLTFNKNLT